MGIREFMLGAVLLTASCNKSEMRRVEAAEMQEASIRGGFICQCVSGDWYRGLVSLTGTKSTNVIYVVFSADGINANSYYRLNPVDGNQQFQVNRKGYPCEKGVLYLVRKNQMDGDKILTNIAQGSTHCTACSLCGI